MHVNEHSGLCSHWNDCFEQSGVISAAAGETLTLTAVMLCSQREEQHRCVCVGMKDCVETLKPDFSHDRDASLVTDACPS